MAICHIIRPFGRTKEPPEAPRDVLFGAASVQNQTSLYERPANQLLFTHEGLGEEQELGEATVVTTMWGTAKVRIVRKQARSRWPWLFAALAVLGTIAAIWLTLAARPAHGPEGVAEPPTVPQAQPSPPANMPVRGAPATAESAPAAAMPDISGQNVPAPQVAVAAPAQTTPPTPRLEPLGPQPIDQQAMQHAAKPEASFKQPAPKVTPAARLPEDKASALPPAPKKNQPKLPGQAEHAGASAASAPTPARSSVGQGSQSAATANPAPLARHNEDGARTVPPQATASVKPSAAPGQSQP